MALSNSEIDKVGSHPQKKTRELQKQQTQARILDASVQIFSTHSYEEAQIKDIAELAGVAHGLLFHYFDNKRSLYLAAVDAIAEKLFDILPFDKHESPYFQIRSLIRNLCMQLSENQDLYFHYVDCGFGYGKDQEALEIVSRRNEKISFWIYEIAGLPHTSNTPRLMMEVISLAVDKLIYMWLKAGRPYHMDILIEASVELLVSALRVSMLLDPTIDARKGIDALIEQKNS
ncbi:MAG: TetR/AcrR family transcriptional regulator [Candidatus Thiodiazotropha sp.]